jgi:hypothetical protein
MTPRRIRIARARRPAPRLVKVRGHNLTQQDVDNIRDHVRAALTQWRRGGAFVITDDRIEVQW